MQIETGDLDRLFFIVATALAQQPAMGIGFHLESDSFCWR
jgi:hypothetical protein